MTTGAIAQVGPRSWRAPLAAIMAGARAVVRLMLRRQAAVAAGAVPVALFSAAVIAQLPLLYSATAFVLLHRSVHELDSFLPRDVAVIETELEIARTPAMAERVIETLGLGADPEFNAAMRPPPKGAARLAMRVAARARALVSGVADVPTPSVNDEVRRRLSVRRRSLTYVAEITFTSRDPVKAAQIANVYAEEMIEARLEAAATSRSRAHAWLSERIEQLRRDVEDAESALEEMRAEHGIFESEGSVGALTSELRTLADDLQAARADRSDAGQARARRIEAAIEEVTAELEEHRAALIRLRELEREAEASRRIYETFLQRAQQVEEMDDLVHGSDFRIVAMAQPPLHASAPRYPQLVALALLASVLAGLAVAATVDAARAPRRAG